MTASRDFTWQFHRVGGLDQVLLRSSDELRHLGTLDPKLWTVLSCPSFGLEFDARTLELVDEDKDGRIRMPEVLAAVDWLCARLRDPSVIAEPKDGLPLECIDTETEEGRRILATARAVLASLGKEEEQELGLDDVHEALSGAATHTFNGDGVLPPQDSLEPDVRQFIQDTLAVSGGVKDAGGEFGINRLIAEAFLQTLTELHTWLEDVAHASVPVGKESPEAWDLLQQLKAKVDDYFLRSDLAGFAPQSIVALNPEEIGLASLEGGILAASTLENLPLARIIPDGELSLASPLNPVWRGPFTRFLHLVRPLVSEEGKLSREDWGHIQEAFAAYASAQGRKPQPVLPEVELQPAATPESLGMDRVSAILDSGVGEKFFALADHDAQVPAAAQDIADAEKLVRFYLHLHRLLMNFVSFHDFYSLKHNAAFQAGTLYLDSRACRLCVPVKDVDKHAPLAGYSQLYLVYCECVRKDTPAEAGAPEKMFIAAAVTAGSADMLMEGRNGVFVDNTGSDWDATVIKIVSNPISLREATWDPYRRFARMLSSQIGKLAGARQQAVMDSAGKSIDSATASPEAGASAAAKFDIGKSVGIFAAIGLALGAIGTAVASIASALFSLEWWQFPLLFLGIFLLISGPSIVVAWIKLHKRNLGPLLEASGWAVNGRVTINYFLGRELTTVAVLPPNSSRSFRDPLAKPKRWPYVLLVVCVLAGAVGAWGWFAYRDFIHWPLSSPANANATQQTAPTASASSSPPAGVEQSVPAAAGE